MSDARAATDLQVQAVVALQEHLPSFMLDEPIIRIIPALCARIDADAARIRELEAALCACADDLEAELNNRYPPAIRKYPCMEIDYQRDMHRGFGQIGYDDA